MADTFFSSTLLVKIDKLSVNVMMDSLVLGTSVALVSNSHCFLFSAESFFCLKHSVRDLLSLSLGILVVKI